MAGASLPVRVGITAVAMLPLALFYCFTLDLLPDQKRT